LHIGAHWGQESIFYQSCEKKVLWVEAIPSVYEVLSKNIREIPGQQAFNFLLGSVNQDKVNFYITSNFGASSSIYELSDKHGWGDLSTSETMKLQMHRLDSVFTSQDIEEYGNWILDTQGSELEILIGAGKLLDFCHSIFVEVSTRETYLGAPDYHAIRSYLLDQGFVPLWEPAKNSHEDLIFVRTSS
jgi:FkbM family methyltransferase